jgi:hypothetical protein
MQKQMLITLIFKKNAKIAENRKNSDPNIDPRYPGYKMVLTSCASYKLCKLQATSYKLCKLQVAKL